MTELTRSDFDERDVAFKEALARIEDAAHRASSDATDVDIEEIIERSHNVAMSEPITRPEIDAKLGTIEAKMDGRLARIEDRFASIDRQFADVRTILTEQKNTAWKAAGAVIGVFVAVFAIYATAFDSGRDTAKLAADAQIKAAQAQQETAAALTQIRQIVSDLKAAQPPQK